MEFKLSIGLPRDAMSVRKAVFIDEQGFHDEFDDTDKTALHIVAYDGSKPVGTCRVFKNGEDGVFILGRLAVLKEYRDKRLGSHIMKTAQTKVAKLGGKEIRLHAQEQAVEFYKKQGYSVCSGMEYEEHCPHYWMKKTL